jgi:hypothetical protein
MTITNTTAQDYWFGPLHLPASGTLAVDDTSDTSLYLTDDTVADAINSLYAAGLITVTGAASPFPRQTGAPQVVHGDGSPEGIVFAPQGSLYLNRAAGVKANSVYTKTSGLHLSTGWVALV